MKIQVDPLSADPNRAYEVLSKKQKFVKLNVRTPTAPAPPNKVRVVCMSDTHSLTPHLKFDIPDGDIFIHAGDFTKCGLASEVEEFSKWLATLSHRHKIVIAGNHELTFQESFRHPLTSSGLGAQGLSRGEATPDADTGSALTRLRGCTYLRDSGCEVLGLRLWGSPWQPWFNGWAFNLNRGQDCLDKWNQIPDNVDILITHTPPLGHGDLACDSIRAGCVDLLATVQQRVKPKYHVFGHIHEGYGVSTDGKIIYVNASTCDINYIPSNRPIVFDVTLPDGYQK